MTTALKCDATPCDHIELVEAISQDMIGKPCPKCGSNLLTEADFQTWLDLIQPSIELAKALGLVADATPDDGQALRINLHENTVKISRPPKSPEGM